MPPATCLQVVLGEGQLVVTGVASGWDKYRVRTKYRYPVIIYCVF